MNLPHKLNNYLGKWQYLIGTLLTIVGIMVGILQIFCPNGFCLDPRSHTSSKQFVFSVANNNVTGTQPRLFLATADGSVEELQGILGQYPRWLSSGSLVYSERNPNTGNSKIVQYPNAISEVIGWDPTRSYEQPAPNRNGTSVAVVVDCPSNSLPNIFLLRDGKISSEPLVDCNSIRTSPDWSPDGQYIAYLSNNDIQYIDIRTGEIRNIPGITGVPQFPRWSPNGQQIAFSMQTPEGSDGIYIWTFGSNDIRLFHNLESTDEIFPVWSSDCTEIAFISRNPVDGLGTILQFNLETGDTKTIVSEPRAYLSLDWKWESAEACN